MPARILVIEDNPANLELVRYLLVAAGHDVSSAANGNDGLALVLLERPDLVISDLQMPGMDGYQLLAALRQDARCSQVPVLALTASSMPGDMESVLAAGFHGYMSKPIEPELFAGEIESILKKLDKAGAPGPG